MRVITFREALHDAMDEEMARDDAVILMGEEVGAVQRRLQGEPGPAGQVRPGAGHRHAHHGRGLHRPGHRRRHGGPAAHRGVDDPQLLGRRPSTRSLNNAAKMRYMSGGQFTVPIVFRGPNGPAEFLASQHSQAFQALYAHIPGSEGGGPFHAPRRQGPAQERHPRRQPGGVPGGGDDVRLEGRGARGGVPGAHRQGGGEAPGPGPHARELLQARADALEAAEALAARARGGGARPAQPAPPGRGDPVRARCARPTAAWSWTTTWPWPSVGSYLAWLVSRDCFDDLDAPVELVAQRGRAHALQPRPGAGRPALGRRKSWPRPRRASCSRE